MDGFVRTPYRKARLPSPRCCVKASPRLTFLTSRVELFEPGSKPGTCRVSRSSGPLLPNGPITVHLSAEPIKTLCRDHLVWTLGTSSLPCSLLVPGR
jgi:hypothetical protein